MSLEPRVLGKRVLLKPLDAQESTEGGVVLPELVREKESRGMVIAVADDHPSPVEIGDVVVYAEHGATSWTHPTKVTIDNDESGKAEEFIVVAHEDLLLVLEEAEVPIR